MDKAKRNFLKQSLFIAATSMFVRSSNALAKTKTFSKRKIAEVPDGFAATVRAEFPLSKSRVYFNNGTIGPSSSAVLNSVIAAMNEVETRAEHHEQDSALLRTKIATFIGADADEISLTHNTSEGVNIIAGGLPLKSGNEVIITTHEHVGGALPWLNRARLDGINLKAFSPPPTAQAVLEKITAMITSKTKVIAVPHVSCTTGQVFPIAEIANLCKEKKLLFFVDGAHGAGMIPLNMHSLGVDFYASCGHKWMCGPKGTGFLYIKKEHLDLVEPKWVGAYSDTGWVLTPTDAMINGLAPNAHRYDFGSQNTALHAGLGTAIDFITNLGQEKISEYGFGLANHLHEALTARADRIEVLTPFEKRSRAMITSFRFKDPSLDYSKFATFAMKNGFRIRQVPEAGLNCLRVSTHMYNSVDEVDRFVALVDTYKG